MFLLSSLGQSQFLPLLNSPCVRARALFVCGAGVQSMESFDDSALFGSFDSTKANKKRNQPIEEQQNSSKRSKSEYALILKTLLLL